VMTLHVARVLPLEAISRLLDGVPAVIVEHRAEDGAFHVASVHIFGRPESEDSETAGPVLDDRVRHALWQGDDHEADVAQDALEVRGEEGRAMLRRVFRDGGRDDRLIVLQAMSERDDDATLVREALDDADPEVRGFAAFRIAR